MADDKRSPFVSFSPGMQWGRATLNHTWLTADTVSSFVAAGDSVDFIADQYEISRADVLVCCWYRARYGTRRDRQLWRDWLDGSESDLWYGHWDKVTDPPPFPKRQRKKSNDEQA